MAIRTAVVGVGVQGERHAQKLAHLPDSELIGVLDVDAGRAASVAGALNTEALQDLSDVIGKATAAIVATPASLHCKIAGTLLENGIHVLVEKPVAASMEEARKLVETAETNGVLLQVGHLERFNPAVVALAEHIAEPQFIESQRIAPYQPRALDVSVVMDLMIHDIDLIHSFVGCPMEHVEAVGRSIFSDNIDVANARIRFANGCVANVTSSRISMKSERSLRIFQADSYMSANLQDRKVTRYSKRVDGPVSGPDDVAIDRQSFGHSDPMMDQAQAFLDSVAGGPPPLVSGRTAMEALATAMVIGEMVGVPLQ